MVEYSKHLALLVRMFWIPKEKNIEKMVDKMVEKA